MDSLVAGDVLTVKHEWNAVAVHVLDIFLCFS